MLSPHKPWDEIQPNLVCELDMNGECNVKLLFGPPPGPWDFGVLGVPRGSKKKFNYGHVVYQIDRDDEQNIMQVKFSS